jgi:hypothetical protein
MGLCYDFMPAFGPQRLIMAPERTDDDAARPLADPQQLLLAAQAPWLARKDWARGTLYDRPGLSLGLWIPGIMGCIFLGISVAFAWDFPRQTHASGWTALLPVLILGSLGIGLTLHTTHRFTRWIKYGGSHLHLETVPIPVGGVCRGTLTLSRRISAGQEVKIRLQCDLATVHEMHSVSPSADERTSQDVNHQLVWEDEETVISDGSGMLAVALAIPNDLPGTTEPNQKFWYSWKLKAEVPGSATSYSAEFDVPVYNIAPTQAQAQDARSIKQVRQQDQAAYQPGPSFRVRVTPAADGGLEIIFPPMRLSVNGALTWPVIFMISMTLFVVAVPTLPIIASVIWTLVNLFIFTWLVKIWLLTERIVVGSGTISFTSGLFRITQTMPFAELKAIHVITGPITRQNAVRIRSTGWKHFDVGDGIRDQRDAEWLAAEMCHAAGIQPTPAGGGNQMAEQMEIMQAFVKDVQGGKINFGPLGNALIDVVGRQKKES